jgi:hypothetical protein
MEIMNSKDTSIRVKELTYEINTGDDYSYDNPESKIFTTPIGEYKLSNNVLVVDLAADFFDLDEAREAVESYLKSYEVFGEISSQPGIISFKYKRAVSVEMESGKEIRAIEVAARQRVKVVGYAPSIHRTMREFPEHPKNFTVTPLINTAHKRWLRYKKGEEIIQTTAYFILTLILDDAGGRDEASKKYNISRRVLSKLSELSSTKGDETTARKALKGGFVKLRDEEKYWIDQTMRVVIKRMGELAAGSVTTKITMNDLPDL